MYVQKKLQNKNHSMYSIIWSKHRLVIILFFSEILQRDFRISENLVLGKVRTFSENLIKYKLERKIWISYPQQLWICLILVINRVRDCFLSVRGTRIRQNMPSCDFLTDSKLGSWKHVQTRVWRHFFWGPDPKIFFSFQLSEIF